MILFLTAAISTFISFELGYFDPHYDTDQYILSGEGYEYNLDKPDEKFVMPPILKEISGISFYNKSKILCVQDEKGLLFQYDIENKSIDFQKKFKDDGDYEGVEIVGTIVYVLESDGDLYSFSYLNNEIGEVKKIDTQLSSKNDTEGLGYDPQTYSLLIACKESGDSKKLDVKGKAIYRVDIVENDFKKKPVINIPKHDLEDYLDHKDLSVKRHNQFSPSAVAVHPGKNGDIFVLASVGKLLLVFDRTGAFKNAVPLNPKIFKQPEGITFDDKDNLFISSEGRGGDGYILEFKNSL